jgi:hypothetical protein
MSTRKNRGSSDQHHQQAAEMHDLAAHAHSVAAQAHEKQDHQTGHERSRQALEHSRRAQGRTHTQGAPNGHSAATHEELAILAYELWEARGHPEGSAEEDWFQAAQRIQVRDGAVAK